MRLKIILFFSFFSLLHGVDVSIFIPSKEVKQSDAFIYQVYTSWKDSDNIKSVELEIEDELNDFEIIDFSQEIGSRRTEDGKHLYYQNYYYTLKALKLGELTISPLTLHIYSTPLNHFKEKKTQSISILITKGFNYPLLSSILYILMITLLFIFFLFLLLRHLKYKKKKKSYAIVEAMYHEFLLSEQKRFSEKNKEMAIFLQNLLKKYHEQALIQNLSFIDSEFVDFFTSKKVALMGDQDLSYFITYVEEKIKKYIEEKI